jgi:glycosyltransferase involved in cell wall biosynthesis
MVRTLVLAERADRSGGAGVYTSQLVRYLAQRGQRVTLVCHEALPQVGEWCEVRRLTPSGCAHLPLLWRAAAPLRTLSQPGLIRALHLPKPDLVIGSNQPMIWSFRRLQPRVPLIYLPHSLIAPLEVATYPFHSEVQRWLAVRTYQFLERYALRHAARTIRFTHAGCAALRAYYGAGIARRFTVLPAPVLLPEPPPESTPASPPRLLFVGRLIRTKGLVTLVQSLDRLRLLPWTLDVVGDGEERPALEAEVHRRGLTGRIVFHGHQDDVTRWYRSASLLVFPSRLESAGLVLLEAMSHGVPALAIRADGQEYRNVNHEIIEHGSDGFLAQDDKDFTALLSELLDQPALVAEVGRRACRKVEELHSWPRHLDRFDRVIARILEKRLAAC